MATASSSSSETTTSAPAPKPEAPASGKIPFENLTFVRTTALSSDKSPVVIRVSDLDEETIAKVKKEYEGS